MIRLNNIKMLKPMSPEQEAIVRSVMAGNNVVIDSVAGSGKTTTSLHICSHLPNKRVLILTYNSRLKIESREKVKTLGLPNVEVHSYHAFCVKYYTKNGFRDTGLQETINKPLSPLRPIKFDIIILDEQQDMTKLFFGFARKIFTDNLIPDVQICSFGDIWQNIYTYAGSDERYLTFANRIFNNPRHWDFLKISTSYRVTKQIANFVNVNLLKCDRLKAIKDGPKVQYVITHAFGEKHVYNQIMKFLVSGYLPEDIFVLGASLKKTNFVPPIGKLENMLVNNGIACYASLNDDNKIDEDIIKSKICFSTFHQVKGMERKICIIYGFDESYFNFYARDFDPTICPNTLYVALTRASERLILVHNNDNKYLPFIDVDILKTTCDIIELKKLKKVTNEKSPEPYLKAVRDLTKNISNEAMTYVFEMVKYKPLREPKKNVIDVQSKVLNNNGLYDDVSDINGLTIPAMYEYSNTGMVSMVEQLIEGVQNGGIDISCSMLPENHKSKIQEIYANYKDLNIGLTVDDALYVSTVYNSIITGFIGKRENLVYGWLPDELMKEALNVMKKYVSENGKYEKQIMFPVQNKMLVGIVDCVDFGNETIWEFKCTGELSKEHILQLVLYSYLYEKGLENIRNRRIPNELEKYEIMLKKKQDVNDLIDICLEEGVEVDLEGNMIKRLVEDKKGKLEKKYCLERKMKYMLLNILTEEIIEVVYDENYVNIVEYLLKVGEVQKVNDTDFIGNCIGNGLVQNVINITDDGSWDGDDEINNGEYAFV